MPYTRVHSVWLHLYEMIGQAKLFYGDKNQNNIWHARKWRWEGVVIDREETLLCDEMSHNVIWVRVTRYEQWSTHHLEHFRFCNSLFINYTSILNTFSKGETQKQTSYIYFVSNDGWQLCIAFCWADFDSEKQRKLYKQIAGLEKYNSFSDKK